MGRVKGSGEGAGRGKFFPPSPSPFSFFRPHTFSKGYYFYSQIFLCHKIKIRLHCRLFSFRKLACLQLLVKGYLKQTFWQRTRAWTIDSAGDWRVTLTSAGGWLWISSTAFPAASSILWEWPKKSRASGGSAIDMRWYIAVMLCVILSHCNKFENLQGAKASAKRTRSARHARRGTKLLARFALALARLKNAKKILIITPVVQAITPGPRLNVEFMTKKKAHRQEGKALSVKKTKRVSTDWRD